MITNGATNFDIELRRNGQYVLAYDLEENGSVVSLSGKTHRLVIRKAATDEEVFTQTKSPDVDNQIIFQITKESIAELSPATRLDFYIVELPSDQMIAYGDVSLVK